ncbi:aspartate kinase [Brevibacillus centrosporus]|uniref:aspartate kinase n=1 Tax=Brevibacillus centrosporus TaxID=54910 RepID=UPI003812528B
MALIVQKYGGTSVGSVERIRAVAQQILVARQQGHELVIVLSAMGDSTDGLMKLALEIDPHPDSRELDMLVSTGEQISISLLTMALRQKGCKAVSLTGWQAGIVTDEEHQDAQVREIHTASIHQWLARGYVVVVAGYQGVTDSGQITTLGRGGSDTSAVALAARLHADLCEIHTDVDGVYTADPRLVPEAKKHTQIPYEQMLELAEMGACVLHPRSVREARKFQVPLVVRSSFQRGEGTRVGGEMDCGISSAFWGIAHQEKMAVLSIKGERREEACSHLAKHFDTVGVEAEAVVSVSDCMQYSLSANEIENAMAILQNDGKRLGIEGWECEQDMTKVTIVPADPFTEKDMTGKLAELPFPVRWLKPVKHRISCVMPSAMSKAVMQTIHRSLAMNLNVGRSKDFLL